MGRVSHVTTAAVLVLMMTIQNVTAQSAAEVWRNFVERVDVGTELNVRLNDGRRIHATLVGVGDDAVLLQPKTRIPVPIQAIRYEEIVRIEPRRAGSSPGRAVAIGIATGVGVFFGILAIVAATISD